jgi:hypothetical protein
MVINGVTVDHIDAGVGVGLHACPVSGTDALGKMREVAANIVNPGRPGREDNIFDRLARFMPSLRENLADRTLHSRHIPQQIHREDWANAGAHGGPVCPGLRVKLRIDIRQLQLGDFNMGRSNLMRRKRQQTSFCDALGAEALIAVGFRWQGNHSSTPEG